MRPDLCESGPTTLHPPSHDCEAVLALESREWCSGRTATPRDLFVLPVGDWGRRGGGGLHPKRPRCAGEAQKHISSGIRQFVHELRTMGGDIGSDTAAQAPLPPQPAPSCLVLGLLGSAGGIARRLGGSGTFGGFLLNRARLRKRLLRLASCFAHFWRSAQTSGLPLWSAGT